MAQGQPTQLSHCLQFFPMDNQPTIHMPRGDNRLHSHPIRQQHHRSHLIASILTMEGEGKMERPHFDAPCFCPVVLDVLPPLEVGQIGHVFVDHCVYFISEVQQNG